MNKNYIFVLTAIVIAIVIIGVVVSYQSPSMTLDQIIKNRDCAALDKWENDHMFDDNLDISSEKMSAAMSLATECVGKALDNMFGNLALSTDTTDPMVVLDEIFKTRDCEDLEEWMRDRGPNHGLNFSSKQKSNMNKLTLECGVKEIENFLRESDVSTDTTDPMVVLGKILNKKDCEGMEAWSNEYPELDVERDMRSVSGFLEIINILLDYRLN